jgi:AAA domain, putative AbiEii toxin, Type IV TA system
VAQLHPIEVDVSRFEAHRSSEDALLEQLAASRDARLELAARAAGLAAEVQEIATRWTQTVAASAWQQDSELIARRYQALIADLTARGISEVGQYGALIQERSLLEAQVRSLMDLATTVAQLRVEADSCTQKSVHLRKEITAKRESFLAAVLAGNPHVQMTIVPYGSLQRAAEMSFRAQLDLKEDKYGDDILSEDEQHGCLAELYLGLPADPVQRTTELERRLVALKVQIDDVRHGVDTHFGGRFRKHLRQLSVEAVDRLQTWFPPDELDVRYREGGRFRALEQGSPGQKTAAILAFLLAHGTEPIILDQPEDDLDNQLIYELIVTQLRANKQRRQVIVVTHNPNIVVNGDAELIVVMKNAAGQCVLGQQGSLQSRDVRAQVCTIMEGGREALQKRYRRMQVGAADV